MALLMWLLMQWNVSLELQKVTLLHLVNVTTKELSMSLVFVNIEHLYLAVSEVKLSFYLAQASFLSLATERSC